MLAIDQPAIARGGIVGGRESRARIKHETRVGLHGQPDTGLTSISRMWQREPATRASAALFDEARKRGGTEIGVRKIIALGQKRQIAAAGESIDGAVTEAESGAVAALAVPEEG